MADLEMQPRARPGGPGQEQVEARGREGEGWSKRSPQQSLTHQNCNCRVVLWAEKAAGRPGAGRSAAIGLFAGSHSATARTVLAWLVWWVGKLCLLCYGAWLPGYGGQAATDASRSQSRCKACLAGDPRRIKLCFLGHARRTGERRQGGSTVTGVGGAGAGVRRRAVQCRAFSVVERAGAACAARASSCACSEAASPP